MPEDKGLGSRLLGLFVEVEPKDAPTETDDAAVLPGDASGQSPADLVAAIANASGPRNKGVEGPRIIPPGSLPLPGETPFRSSPSGLQRAEAAPVPHGPAGVKPATVDFDAVFRNAGLDAQELDRVRKAEALLASLPESTPLEVKRQIVEASLKAFGFDLARIVAAAQTQAKAVDTWVRVNDQQTQKAVGEARAKIAQLEEQVISLRADIEKRTEQLGSMAAAADVRRGQLKAVIDFFQGAAP